MIQFLELKNISLFESCHIDFENGFHIFTGETGAGKTALLSSIGLILGEKAEPTIIRKGKNCATIEASFSIQKNRKALALLTKEELSIDPNFPVIIRRELSLTGKNRVFINDQLVSLSFLKELGKTLVELVSQHSPSTLLNATTQREILDLFSNLENETKLFSEYFAKMRELKKTLQELTSQKEEKAKKLALLQEDLQKIEEANLLDNEDETLSKEHLLLANTQEIIGTLATIDFHLHEKEENILSTIHRFLFDLEKLSAYDHTFITLIEQFKNISIELDEVVHTIHHKKAYLEMDPDRLFKIEERLATIHKLKKKYGSTISEIKTYAQKLHMECQNLESLDASVLQTEKEIFLLAKTLETKAHFLTEQRTHFALKLQQLIEKELYTLNMQNARLVISIQKEEMTESGVDNICFYFSANKGENMAPLKDCISGGELSRLMLVIKTILAEKETIPSIVFDEIDANIGGQTATILGDRLKSLGSSKQILSITHFGQVAKHAHHHFRIYKEEIEGRTLSFLEKLSQKTKEFEYQRMAGLSEHASFK